LIIQNIPETVPDFLMDFNLEGINKYKFENMSQSGKGTSEA